MSKILISKLDAAKRQLETALELFFKDGDPVSIHTLVFASHEILAVVCRENNLLPSMLKDQMLKNIRPEKKDKWEKLITTHAAFFKHAARDAFKTINFNPEINELPLFDACLMYLRIAGSNTFLQRTFLTWFHAKDPNIFIHTPEELVFLKKRSIELPIYDKPAFLNLAQLADPVATRSK